MALTQYAVSNSSTSPVRKFSYTVGLAGVAGCDYNFTSVANMTEQSIQLGATTIVAAYSVVSSIVASCSVAMVGGNATADIGTSSGSDEWLSAFPLSTLNATTSVSANVAASATAGSVYFSMTPDANWNTLSAAKWIIEIYVNNGNA